MHFFNHPLDIKVRLPEQTTMRNNQGISVDVC